MLKPIAQFIGLALTSALLFAAPAQACQGVQFEHHVIMSTLPTDVGDVEFIGKVKVRNKRKWLFFNADDSAGFLASVTESTTHPHLVGTSIEIPPILGTSCGPWLDGGDRGYMLGIFENEDTDRPLLHPKAFSGMDLFAQ